MKRLMIRLSKAAALLVLAFGGQQALAQGFRFGVEHDHALKSCKGELTINAGGIEYQTENKNHARKWAYTDIKVLKLISHNEVEIISYESTRIRLGGDRSFKFKVLTGEIMKDVSDFLLAGVERPLVISFVATDEKPRHEIPVRHRHRVSGCQGTLKIYADRLVFESEKAENSRYWRWADIKSISRTGHYQFAIATYEPEFGGPSRTFNFDLKEHMDEAVYDYLWARVYKVRLPALVRDGRLAERRQQ